jgi:diguanylate cyclase (GGDEF)-like protein/PAS domain S-box-containing protein
VEERRTTDGGSIGVRIDITDLKRREASFRLLFEENPLPMWVADGETRQLVAVNAAMCRHYGYSRDQLLAMSERDLSRDGDAVCEGTDGEAPAAVLHRTGDGGLIEVVTEARPLLYHGRPAWVAVAFDVTERNRAEARIRYLASHDPLTELPNRTALDEHLSRLIDGDGGSSFAVLCIDLDRFKWINDMFGHSVGDAVLREASRRLREAAGSAYVARVGGDEFIATTDELPLPGCAELLASRMRSAFKQPIEVDGHSLEVDLSIGMAMFPRDGDNQVLLLANADAALYRAKHEGRGAVRLFTSAMDHQLRERRAMEHDLRFAVDNGELYLEYQPQQDRGGDVMGFEALVRWRHPQRGIVPPATFIPIAEEGGAIARIDQWVLRQACRQAALWQAPARIAVNVSAAQFRRGNLEHQVKAALRDSRIEPSRLELEITEGVLIEDIARASETLRSLKALGVKIALDDFGTGYSSLSYLEAFPLDRIKIDRSFVAALGTTGRSLAIVRAVIGLAHGFSVPVLAEGVETTEQLAILTYEGCDEFQGYLIGRPKPAEDCDGLLQESSAAARASA